ncbi:MAG TPA: hypothetical protein VFU99_01835 [Gaiellaceae bacterium]|nr:hypothetical protein [Gaiellaceae bacterium]
MESRPMPLGAVAAVCALLVGLASAMTLAGIALAADGAFQLVQVLAAGDVYGLDARILGAAAHQGAVVLAARAGETDTHTLTVLLGVGQLLLPATAWALCVVLTRSDRLVCAAVAMIAGLSAGATWFVNVSEIVLAAPLTTVVAVCLWQPRSWRWHDTAVAATAATVLVAAYETALATGLVLAIWAAWRARGSRQALDRIGCTLVSALSALSLGVAAWGTRTGSNPTHSQSLLYFVVSLEPWPLYLGLAGIAAAVAALGPWLTGTLRLVILIGGCSALGTAALGLEPGPVTAFEARGGAAIAAFALELFLLWRWIERRRPPRTVRSWRPGDRLAVLVPLALVAALVGSNVQPIRTWSRSLDAFRVEVDRAPGIRYAVGELPSNRRDVLWGWTASSLSLVVRSRPDAGILVDRNPSLVPFPADDTREQLADEYLWRR